MQLTFSRDDLRPVVVEVVAELLETLSNDERLAYTETEAAATLGIARHVLRDERLKGNIEHGKAGRKILYSKRQLLEFVEGK